MGSEIDTAMASDLASALAVTGQPIVHVDFEGAETSLTGQFQETGDPVRQAGDRGQAVQRRATAVVAQGDLADPRPGHTLMVGEEGWSIETRQPIAGGAYWQLALVRTAPAERSRRDYRATR